MRLKLSKSAKEFRCHILRWDGPACQCQTCVLSALYMTLCYKKAERDLESCKI